MLRFNRYVLNFQIQVRYYPTKWFTEWSLWTSRRCPTAPIRSYKKNFEASLPFISLEQKVMIFSVMHYVFCSLSQVLALENLTKSEQAALVAANMNKYLAYSWALYFESARYFKMKNNFQI